MVKHDDGKLQASILGDFSHALVAVAEVGTYGAEKYSLRGWLTVPSAPARYRDAMWRHLLAEGINDIDLESNMPHLYHLAWNVLALIELKRRGEENE